MFSFLDVLDESLTLEIVNVGASDMEVNISEPYQGLLQRGNCRIIGFEPNPVEWEKLQKSKSAQEEFLPYALGDGNTHQYRFCRFFGMNSLLEPNRTWLDETHFHGQIGTVVKTVDIETKRLDDIAEITQMDYLKMDIQGGELMVLENSVERLKTCLAVHTEVMFVPMYEGQPLFSEIELFLRKQGFILHHFNRLHSLMLKPLSLQLQQGTMQDSSGKHDGISQLFFSDAIFIRDFTQLDRLDRTQILKLCTILHDMYKSFDVVLNILMKLDQRDRSDFLSPYRTRLAELQYSDFIKTHQRFPPPSLFWT